MSLFYGGFETVGKLGSLSLMTLAIDGGHGLAFQPARSGWDLEEEFLKLADACPAMVWMARLDGHRTFSNQAWLDFRRRSQEDEFGLGWADGIISEDRDVFLREYLGFCAARQPFRIEYRMMGRDGAYQHVEMSARPWFDSKGQAAGYVGVSSPVSQTVGQIRAAARELEQLSPRERQILQLVAQGYATKEAANHLGISYKTADSHRSHILKKLGMHETASLVRFAIRSGLIDP